MSDRERRTEIARAAQQDDPQVEDQGQDRMRMAAMVRRKAVQPTSGGSELDGATRGRMEKALGAELSGVRVHTDGEAAQRSEQLGARAYTEGADVHFAAGQFQPGTKEGDRLIAHELTHVIQGGANKGGAASSAAKAGAGGGGGAAAHRKAEPEAAETEAGAEAPAAEGESEGKEAEGVEVSDPAESAETEADSVADQATEKMHGDGEKGAAGGEADAKESQGEDMGAAEKTEETPKISAKLDGAARKVYRWQDYEKGKDKSGRDTPIYDGEERSVEEEGQFGGVSKEKQAEAQKVSPAKIHELEKRIGLSAYGKGAGVAQALMGTIRSILKTEVEQRKAKAEGLDAVAEESKLLLETCGVNPRYDLKGIAGSVERNATVLEDTMSKGNLREQMTIINNFGSSFPKLMAGKSGAEEEQMHGVMLDKGKELKARSADAAAKAASTPENPVSGRPAVEGVAGAEHKQLGARGKPGAEGSKKDDKVENPTVGELTKQGNGLSANEMRTMFPDQVAAMSAEEQSDPAVMAEKLKDEQVTWAMGVNQWAEREHSEFGEKLAALNMPFVAGPSGTTSRICDTAIQLGQAPDANLRAACIGYLLPIQAHSLWEVVEGAKTQGIDGPSFAAEGLAAYTHLEPFQDETVKMMADLGISLDAAPDVGGGVAASASDPSDDK